MKRGTTREAGQLDEYPGVFPCTCITECHLMAIEDCHDKPFTLIGSKAKPKQTRILLSTLN